MASTRDECVAATAALVPFASALVSQPGLALSLAELRSRVADMLAPLARSFELGGRPAVKGLARWAECSAVDDGFQQGKWFGGYAPPLAAQAGPPQMVTLIDLAQFKGLAQAASDDINAVALGPLRAGGPGAHGGAGQLLPVPGSGAGVGPGGDIAGSAFTYANGERYLRLPGQRSSFEADTPASAGSKDARGAVLVAVSSNLALLLRRLGRPWCAEAVLTPGFTNAIVEVAALGGFTSPAVLGVLASGSLPPDLDILLAESRTAGGGIGSVGSALAQQLEFLVRFQEGVFGEREFWAAGLRSLLSEWQTGLATWGVEHFREAWRTFTRYLQSNVEGATRSLHLSLPTSASQYDASYSTAAWGLHLADPTAAWGSASGMIAMRSSGAGGGVPVPPRKRARPGTSGSDDEGTDGTKGVCFAFANNSCAGGCGYSHDPKLVAAFRHGRGQARRDGLAGAGTLSVWPASRGGGAVRGRGRGVRGSFGASAGHGTAGSETQGAQGGGAANGGVGATGQDASGGAAAPGASRS